MCLSVQRIRVRATKKWYIHCIVRHGHQLRGLKPHPGRAAVVALDLDCCFGPSHELEMTESRLSSALLMRVVGGAGDDLEEGLDVVVSLSEVMVGTQSVFPGGSVGNCRRSDVLLVDLVITAP